MNSRQAKKAIVVFGINLKLGEKAALCGAVDLLKRGVNESQNFFNGFEFSLIGEESKIRFIHLSFWRSGLKKEEIKDYLGKRKKIFLSVFKRISAAFHCQYDLVLYKSFLRFNVRMGPWPVQFGFERNTSAKPKIKIYFSVNAQKFPLEKFCGHFSLDYGALNKIIKKRKLDTVAIDFFPDGKKIMKFYPISSPNSGFLFRIGDDSRKVGTKIWRRFPQGISVPEAEKLDFGILSARKRDFIEKNNFKIHYLCEEDGRKSIYFR